MPVIQKVVKDRDDFTMISIAIDSQNDPKNYVKKKGYTWTFGLDKTGSDVYDIQTIPTTIFIDKDGKVVKKKIGSMTEKEFLDTVDKITQ